MSVIGSFCNNDGEWAFWYDGDVSPCYAALGSSVIPLIWICLVGWQYNKMLYGLRQRTSKLHFREKLLLSFSAFVGCAPLFILIVRAPFEPSSPYEVFFAALHFVNWGVATWLVRKRFRCDLSAYARTHPRPRFSNRLFHPSLNPLSKWPLLTFWIAALLFASVQLRSLTRLQKLSSNEDVHFKLFCGLYPLYILVLLLGFFCFRKGNRASIVPTDDSTTTDSPSGVSPQEEVNDSLPKIAQLQAGWFSTLTFTWLSPLIAKGYRAPLQLEDVDELMPSDKAAHNLHRFQAVLRQRVADNGGSRKGMTRAVMGTAWKLEGHTIAGSLFLRLGVMSSDFIGPLLLNLLVSYLENPNDAAWFAPENFGFFIVFLSFLVSVCRSFMMNWFFQHMLRVGLRLRSTGIALIYAEAVCLTSHSLQELSQGKIQNMMSSDMFRIENLFVFGFNALICPLQIVITLGLMFFYVGWQGALGAVAMMLLLLPIQAKAGKRMATIKRAALAFTDKRVTLISELFQGIRVIKFQAWETSFLKVAEQARAQELKQYWKAVSLHAFNMMCVLVTPALVTMCAFGLYAATQDVPLGPASAFTVLVLVDQLRMAMLMIPQGMTSFVEAKIAINRLVSMLETSDLVEEVDTSSSALSTSSTTSSSLDMVKGEVRVENMAFFRTPDQVVPTMSVASFRLSPGSLTVVVGSVGSGKSFLVLSLLGEIYHRSVAAGAEEKAVCSSVFTRSAVAYVAQTAWIINGTVKDNILFGADYDQELYDETLRVCCLVADLVIWPLGDMTEIGERGINLSGGQRQRVSLARAVYRRNQTEIFYFDDPLSALDAQVGRTVYQECIMGVLKNKTRVLVTHHCTYAKDADTVVYMESMARKNRPLPNSPKNTAEKDVEVDVNKDVETNVEDNVEPSPESLVDSNMKSVESNAETDIESSAESSVESVVRIKVENSSAESSAEASAEESKPVQLHIKEVGTFQQLMHANTAFAEFFNASQNVEAVSAEQAGSPTNKNKTSEAKTEVKDTKTESKLVAAEGRATGAVQGRVLLSYARSCGPWLSLLVLFWLIMTQVCIRASDTWLAQWTDDAEGVHSASYYITIYFIISLGTIICTLSFQLMGAWLGNRGARVIHRRMLARLMRAPMSFFDTTPLGRLLNRFTRDMDIIDLTLPQILINFMNLILQLFALLVMVCVVTQYFAFVLLPLTLFFFWLQRYYRRTSRELKRLDSITRSPLLAHIAETLDGLITIRAYHASERMKEINQSNLNYNFKYYYMNSVSNRWLGTRLDMIGSIILVSTGLFMLIIRDSVTPGLVGLAVGYAMLLANRLNFTIRQSIETEVNLNAVERTDEYSEVPIEGNPEVEGNPTVAQIFGEDLSLPDSCAVSPPLSWPSEGKIVFDHVSMRYRPSTPLVLKDLTLTIEPGERVGVVGRTGAGKSSLMLLLFRMVECAEGTVSIDGIDIKSLRLQSLRSKLSIIPQDPLLFSGSVRYNLDPFDQAEDAEIWRALKRVQLDRYIEQLPSQLQATVEHGGSNFSLGQRQLFCFARAILRKSKILVLDEATASVDMETDSLIQKMLRHEFSACTVLTIAHRLDTIIDYHKVIVLDQGSLVEYGTPQELMSRPQGHFSRLLAHQHQ